MIDDIFYRYGPLLKGRNEELEKTVEELKTLEAGIGSHMVEKTRLRRRKQNDCCD